MQTISLFVSSPGDVREERQVVGGIVERVQARYWNFVRIEPVMWEKEPLRATAHFNEELVKPSDCDLFIGILWSRLGSPLPSQFNRADGSRFDSGTEWEIEEATNAFEARRNKNGEKAKPDILMYRRMSPPPADAEPAQLAKLEAFSQRFFFNADGTIRRAFSPYQTLNDFAELLENHLEKLVLRGIQMQRGLAQESVRPLPIEGSPFKGLGAFDFSDASLFFGRNRAISESLAQWKENHAAGHAFLLIYGASGYGKSSLMRAGLAPRLTAAGYITEAKEWQRLTLIPTDALIKQLAQALNVDAELLENPESIPKAVAALQSTLQSGKHLLLMIDQLEEVFTHPLISEVERENFFNVLAALAMCGNVWIVATMRSEFFPRIAEIRSFHDLVRHNGGYILGPPELGEISQIIRYPALAAGLEFERDAESSRDLSAALYQDAIDAPDALPLLEFTLEELYQRREENILTWKAYGELGGLRGAISQRAQEVYENLPEHVRGDAARAVFAELVTLGHEKGSTVTRKRTSRVLLEKSHPGAMAFISAFTEAKLLVTAESHGVATVTLAHEALCTHWAVLREWIDEHRELLHARKRLEDAVQAWEDHGGTKKYLLSEGRLADAQRVADSGVFQLSAGETELLRLSRLKARRKTHFLQAAVVVFAALAAVSAVMGVIAKKKQLAADKAEAATRVSLAAADFDAGASRAESGNPQEALPFLLESLRGDPKNLEAQALLIHTLRQVKWNMPLGAWKNPGPVTHVAFDREGKNLFTGIDHSNSKFTTLVRWDLASSTPINSLFPIWGAEIQTLSISPNGEYCIIQRGYKRPDQTLLCNTTDMSVVAELDCSGDASHETFAWSNDSTMLAYPHQGPRPDYKRSWIILRSSDGKRLLKHGYDGIFLAAHLNADHLLAIEEDGEVMMIPLDSEERAQTESIDTDGKIDAAVFSPDGKNILVRKSTRDSYNGAYLTSFSVKLSNGVLSCSQGGESSRYWENTQQVRDTWPYSYWSSPFWKGVLASEQAGTWLPLTSSDSGLRAPLSVRGGNVEIIDHSPNGDALPCAPLQNADEVRSYAEYKDMIAIGTAGGNCNIFHAIPRIGYPMPAGKKRDHEDYDSWLNDKHFANGLRWENEISNGSLRRGEEKICDLERHELWQMLADVDVDAEAKRAVICGYGSSTAGYVSPGLLLLDASNGQVLSDLYPLQAPRSVLFLKGRQMIAAAGSESVVLLDTAGDQLTWKANLPATGVMSMKALTLAGDKEVLALANTQQVDLFDLRDQSKIMSLPLVAKQMVSNLDTGGLEARMSAWAMDETRGWLALRLGTTLHVWHIASGRRLIADVALPDGADQISFTNNGEWLGLRILGDVEAFVPLAREAGWDAATLSLGQELCAALGGVEFSNAERSLAAVPAERRIQILQSWSDTKQLATLLGSGADAWKTPSLSLLPDGQAGLSSFWERLILTSSSELDSLVDITQPYADQLWRKQMMYAMIGQEDADLFAPAKPKDEETESDNWAIDGVRPSSAEKYHRLNGDDSGIGRVKDAAWIVKNTVAADVGRVLADPEHREDLEDISDSDWSAIEQMKPSALKVLDHAMADYPLNDWRKKLLAIYRSRDAAIALVEQHLATTRQAWETNPTDDHGFRLVTASMLARQVEEAKQVLATLEQKSATPSLEHAHFLLSCGLFLDHPPMMDRALKAHQSPWLERDWLAAQTFKPQELVTLTTSMMAKNPKASLANVALLIKALETNNSEAMRIICDKATKLPKSIPQFCDIQRAWRSGDKRLVYQLWDKDLDGSSQSEADFHGWEEIEFSSVVMKTADQIHEELDQLRCESDTKKDDALRIADRLLNDGFLDIFGRERISRHLVPVFDNLYTHNDTTELLERLKNRAEELELAPLPLSKMTGMFLMKIEQYAEAAPHWKRHIELSGTYVNALSWNNYTFCLLQSKQVDAAWDAMLEGADQMSTSYDYFLSCAWQLLQFQQPDHAYDIMRAAEPNIFRDDYRTSADYLILCAAEMSGRTEDADRLCMKLISNKKIDDDKILDLNWPEPITAALQDCLERNRKKIQ